MHRRGEIILIPIPFSDLTSIKKRPVLVLSSNRYNEKTEDLIVAAVTSNNCSGADTVKITQSDFVEGNLPHESWIRADKLYSLSQKIALKRMGMIKDEVLASVIKKILNILDYHEGS